MNSSEQTTPRVVFVESRPRRQELLRDYVGKRGFLPMFLPDAREALDRLAAEGPDAVAFTAEMPNKMLFEVFLRVRQLTTAKHFVAVFVFTESQSELRDDLQPTPTCRIIQRPIVLRELRRQLHLGLKERES